MRSIEERPTVGDLTFRRAGIASGLGTLLFAALLAVLAVGDLDIRLANTPADDNPLFYAHLFHHLNAFSGDIVATYGQGQILATLQNWLPLLGAKIGIPPITTVWFLVLAQTVLLGLALLDLCPAATCRGWATLLLLPFTFAAQPWAWNVANYGGVTFFSSPLATYLALPFVLFAAAAALRGQTWRTGLYLLICGLIHVTITFYLVLILAGFWFLECRSDQRQLLKKGALLAAVSGICILPRLSLQAGGSQVLTGAEWVEGIRLVNTHIFPWRYPGKWDQMMPAFFGFLFLAGLSLRGLRQWHSAFTSFWLSSLGALALMVLATAAGIHWQVPQLLQLYPLRISLLLVLFSLPPALAYLADKLQARRWLDGWAAAALLLSLGFSSYGVFWGPLLALGLTDLAAGHLGPLQFRVSTAQASGLRLAAGVLLGGWTAAALSMDAAHLGLLAPTAGQELWRYGAGLAAAAVLFAHLSGSRTGWAAGGLALAALALAAEPLQIGIPGFGLGQWAALGLGTFLAGISLFPGPWLTRLIEARTAPWVPVTFLGLALAGLALFEARLSGAETDRADLRASYEAQRWAQEHTPPEAVFIGYGQPWRTYAHRRLVDPSVQGWYVYSRDRRAKDFDDQVLHFYGLAEASLTMDIQELNQAQSRAYFGLDEQGILRLSRQFGGDYLIRPLDHPLAFPEAYRNERLVIYHLTGLVTP